MKRFFHDNGLSIVLFALFAIILAGQAVAGWKAHNKELEEHDRPAWSFPYYLGSGAFGEAVFENWESEFLQMGMYVLLTAFLFQRGSAESKDPDGGEEEDLSPGQAPFPVRKGGWILRVYEHSLSLVLLALFAASLAAHALFGLSAHNEEAARHGEGGETLLHYVSGSQFWFESLQNWQSEFLSIFVVVLLSIWLREKGSPESKEVAAPHSQTGR